MTAATDIKERLRDPEMESHESQPYVVWTLVDDCLLDDAADRIEQLERDLAEAQKDAGRYRHLRECNSGSLCILNITGMGDEDQTILTEVDADNAIDAAIAKDKQ